MDKRLSLLFQLLIVYRDNILKKFLGGGIGMGNTCKSMADSCQCMAKTTIIL